MLIKVFLFTSKYIQTLKLLN